LKGRGQDKLYSAVLLSQEDRCGICGKPPKKPRGLRIDHDHETGMVRGLLCNGCNTGLGSLGDDEAGLVRALAYILRSKGGRWSTIQVTVDMSG
jgi:hypothetical protein